MTELLLKAMRAGRLASGGILLPLVYSELHRLAKTTCAGSSQIIRCRQRP